MISLEIFIARLARHLRRKCWSWRLFVPADFLEVITNVLLVKRFLRAPGLVLVRRPEAGRIWPADKYQPGRDRKSTRLNSSHGSISYAVFCLKKKNKIR